jgi:hypothetical protein
VGACPSCGAPHGDPVIELLSPDDGEAGGGDVVLAPPGRGRRRTVVVVVAVALIGAVALVGRNGGGTAATATTVPATAPPSGSALAPRAAPSPSFSESHAFMSFLNAPTQTILYGVGPGSLLRIDLDGGVVTQRRLRGEDRTDPPVAVFGATGGAMLEGTNQTVLVGDGPDGGITPIAGGGIVIFPSNNATEIWTVRVTGPDTQAAQLDHLDGSPAGPVLTVSDGTVLGDDGTGSLLVQTTNGVVRFDPDGASAQRMSGSPLVAWSATMLVTESCDAQMNCVWTAVDRTTGATRSLGPPPPGAVIRGGQLSPDGTWMAYLVVGPGSTRPTLQAIELASGNRLVLDPAVMMPPNRNANDAVWSADGRWLFWLTDAGVLRAWATGLTLPVTVQGGDRIGSLLALGRAPSN